MRKVNSPVRALMKELKLEVLVDRYSPTASAVPESLGTTSIASLVIQSKSLSPAP